eukprot:COSAG02_NODE_1242_length_13682_cov_1219.312523_3_plen_118_part_00
MPRARGGAAAATNSGGAGSALALREPDAAAAAAATTAAAGAASLIPAEATGMTPKLQNIVCTVTLGCPLDLKRITLHARNAEYNPKRCVRARPLAREAPCCDDGISEGCTPVAASLP